MFPAGEKLGKRWRAGRKWKSPLSSEGVFSAEFGAGNGADFGNFYVRLLGKAWYPVFLSDTSSEGVENVFSMAWTSANILTGESYSACRDGREVRLGKLGSSGRGETPASRVRMFPGLMPGWKIAFSARDKVRERVSGAVKKFPKTFFRDASSPSFLQTRLTSPQPPGLTNKRAQKKTSQERRVRGRESDSRTACGVSAEGAIRPRERGTRRL